MNRQDGDFSGLPPRLGGTPPGPFAKVLAAVVAVVLFGVALMFSLVFVVVAVGLGLLAWAWLWWKTRRVRRELDGRMADMAEAMRARQASAGEEPRQGAVIEGEVVEVEIVREPPRRND